MPGPALHLSIADSLGLPPVQELYAGALAPDLGYYPGTEADWLSDLAHYVTPGVFTQRLWENADVPATQAFAIGWASHVIADQRLHPKVNTMSRRILKRDDAVTFAENPAVHLQCETGLDKVWGDEHPVTLDNPFIDLGPEIGRLLARTLVDVYNLAVAGDEFDAMFTKAARVWPLLRKAGPTRAERSPARSLPAALAFPVAPTDFELYAVEVRVARACDELAAALGEGFETVADTNLDTGRHSGPVDRDYPPARAIAEWLEEQGAVVPRTLDPET